MVDRYLLPIPKTKNFKMYTALKNKPLASGLFLLGVTLMSFQLNRYIAMRTVNI